MRPVPKPPYCPRPDAAVLEVAPERSSDDADGFGAASDRKLAALDEAGDPGPAGDAALLGRAAHEILEDDPVRNVVAACGRRGEESAGQGRARPDHDVRPPPQEERCRPKAEQRELVECALRRGLRARDVVPAANDPDAVLRLSRRQLPVRA